MVFKGSYLLTMVRGDSLFRNPVGWRIDWLFPSNYRKLDLKEAEDEVREPEVLGYAQDMAANRPVTVYLAGHTAEDPGMGLLADWLKTVFPALPVQWLEMADPYTNPG